MNRYLMRIKGYFAGWEEFEVDADSKHEAFIRAREYCEHHQEYGHGGNFELNSIEFVKKINKKRKDK